MNFLANLVLFAKECFPNDLIVIFFFQKLAVLEILMTNLRGYFGGHPAFNNVTVASLVPER